MPQRATPERSVPQRQTSRPQAPTKQKTLVQIKQKEAKKQKTLKKLSKNIGEVVESQKKISPDVSEKIIKKNISKVPPSLRSEFKKRVRKKVEEQLQKQKQRIKKVKDKIETWESRAEVFDERDDVVNERDYLRRVNAAEDVLKRLKKGEQIPAQEVIDFAKAKGRRERIEQQREQQKEKASKKQADVNVFIRKQVEKGKQPSIKSIKDRFDLSLAQAQDVSQAIREGKKQLEQRREKLRKKRRQKVEDLVNEFDEDISLSFDKLDISPRMSIGKKTLDKIVKKAKNKGIKGAEKLRDFYELSPRERDVVLSYSSIRQAQKNLPSKSQIKKIEEAEEFSDKERTILKQLDKDLKFVNVPEPTAQDVINKKQKQDIRFLRSLSKKQIVNAIKKNNVSRINDAIKSFNTVLENRRKASKQRKKDILEKIETKLKEQKLDSALEKLIGTFPPVAGVRGLRRLYLNSLRTEIKERKKDGFSSKDYREVLSSIDDVTGLKRGAKNVVQRLSPNKRKSFIQNKIDFAKELGKITAKTGKDLGQVLARDVRAVLSFLENAQATMNDMLTGAYDFSRLFVGDLSKKQREKLSESVRRRIKSRAKEGEAIEKTVKKLIKNPGLIASGAAVMTSKGIRGIANTLAKDPERAAAEVLSFFVPEKGILLVRAAKGKAKQAAATERLRKSLKKNVDPDLKVVDWPVEKLKLLESKFVKDGGTYYFTKGGNYAIAPNQNKISKQLNLLKSSEFKKKFPALPPAKKLKDVRVVFVDDKQKNWMIITKKAGKKSPGKQKTLADFDSKLRNVKLKKEGFEPKFKKLPKNLKDTKIPDFRKNEVVFETPYGRVILKTKKDTSELKKLFKGKKGQARRLSPQQIKKPVRELKAIRKEVKEKINTYSKKSATGTKAIRKNDLRALSSVLKTISALEKYLKKRELTKARLKKAQESQLKSRAKAQLKSRAKARLKSRGKARLKSRGEAKLKSRAKAKTIKKLEEPGGRRARLPDLKDADWGKKLPKGVRRRVNALIKREGKIKELKTGTTKNRAIQEAVKQVDKSPSRSFQIKIVGLTRKKDVKEPAGLQKFRKKRKSGKVLEYVEKKRFAFDRPGERRKRKKK